MEVTLEHVDNATSGRRGSADRATEVERFAGHHRGLEPVGLGVFVDHPSHDLRSGVDVRCGHVDVRPDESIQGVGENASHDLEFRLAHTRGVDPDTTLRASEGHVHHSGLPCHQ